MHAPINDSLISMHIWSALWTIMDTVGLTKQALEVGREKCVCVWGEELEKREWQRRFDQTMLYTWMKHSIEESKSSERAAPSKDQSLR